LTWFAYNERSVSSDPKLLGEHGDWPSYPVYPHLSFAACWAIWRGKPQFRYEIRIRRIGQGQIG